MGFRPELLNQRSATFLASGTSFGENKVSMGQAVVDDFVIIQVHYIYCTLYLYYYYISSASDHQASDPDDLRTLEL